MTPKIRKSKSNELERDWRNRPKKALIKKETFSFFYENESRSYLNIEQYDCRNSETRTREAGLAIL